MIRLPAGRTWATTKAPGRPGGPALRREREVPGPKNTPLTLGQMSYYFRTHFSFNGNPEGASLQLNTILDDGRCFTSTDASSFGWVWLKANHRTRHAFKPHGQ